jgi:hypothetical protein
VYIDNSGTDTMVVTVDGKKAATIEPGEFAKLDYPPGEYRFHILYGEEVVCDLARNLEKSDRFGIARKYLFDPLKGNRYQTYEAKYGGSRLDGVMQASLLKYQKDPKIKRQYVYKQLLKEIKLIPTDAWNDVTGIEYVLTAPPDVVMTKGSTAYRSVLDRIDERDYEWLKRMSKIEEPTDEDIDSLGELIDEVLSKAL